MASRPSCRAATWSKPIKRTRRMLARIRRGAETGRHRRRVGSPGYGDREASSCPSPSIARPQGRSVPRSSFPPPIERLDHPEHADEGDQDRFYDERGVLIDPRPPREQTELVAG